MIKLAIKKIKAFSNEGTKNVRKTVKIIKLNVNLHRKNEIFFKTL